MTARDVAILAALLGAACAVALLAAGIDAIESLANGRARHV